MALEDLILLGFKYHEQTELWHHGTEPHFYQCISKGNMNFISIDKAGYRLNIGDGNRSEYSDIITFEEMVILDKIINKND